MTALRFWRCPDCHQKGQTFKNLDGVVGERERLAGLEGEIDPLLGAADYPIGPTNQEAD